MLFTCQGTTDASCRVVILLCMLSLYAERRKSQYKILHKKARLILCKLMKQILYILQYIIAEQPKNSKCRSEAPEAPQCRFSGQDVFLYTRSFYSVIQFSYSLIIHCSNGKQLCYTLKKLEYTRIVLIIVQLFYVYTV